MPENSVCPHRRTQLIAKDDDAEYVECLDCGAILEHGELATAQAVPDTPGTTPTAEKSDADSSHGHSSDESLADA